MRNNSKATNGGNEMTNKEILNEVLRKVESATGENVSVKKVTKNNGVELTGVVITMKDATVAPVIYVDEYLEKVVNNEMTVEQVSDAIAEAYRENKYRCELMPSNFKNKDFILENVIYQLVNADMNEERLKTIPYKEVMDLAAIYRLAITNNSDSVESAVLTNEILDTVGISAKEIEEAAMKNINRTEFSVRPLKEVLISMGMPEAAFEGDIGPRLYVITNDNCINGATALLRDDVLRKLADTIDDNFYILPSSINELIAIPVKDVKSSLDDLRGLVASVNSTEVTEDELLSYNVYIYNKEEGKLSIAK